MTAVAALTRTWRVGQFTVTLSLPRAGYGIAACEWAPYMPSSLTDAERQQYQTGMNDALVDLLSGGEFTPCE